MSDPAVVLESKPCKLCGNDGEWHRTNNPRHPFTLEDAQDWGKVFDKPDNQPVVKRGDAPRVQFIPAPSDPVLRIALINKGILTPADLLAAEQELRDAANNQRTATASNPGRSNQTPVE